MEFFYLQRTSDSACWIGRTPQEALTQGQIWLPGGPWNGGKFYVLLDKDRVYALIGSYVIDRFNLKRAIAGQPSFTPLSNINAGLGAGTVNWFDLIAFESPRATFSHGHDPVSW